MGVSRCRPRPAATRAIRDGWLHRETLLISQRVPDGGSRRPDAMKRVFSAGWHEVDLFMVRLSPSKSRTLEPYDSPSLLPWRRKAPGARFLEFEPRGLLASNRR